MEYLIVVAIALVLFLVVHASFDGHLLGKALWILGLAFAARLAVHAVVMRSGVLAYGGDNYVYETKALQIVEYWDRYGFQFVTSEQIPDLYSAALPCNLFALIVYLCGGPASLACTALVAFVACGLVIVMYRFALLLGAGERSAFRLLAVMAFFPALLLHTSDMFKDGFSAFLAVTCLFLAVSNARSISVPKLLLLGPLLWTLWNVRPYMVFMCGLPILFAFTRLQRAQLLCFLAFLIAMLVPVMLSSEVMFEDTPIAEVQEQLERGQSETFRQANAEGGSGVVFQDEGNAWSALPSKLFYTLFSPFPWTEGSTVLQLAKVETLFWYYFLYLAVRGAGLLWRRNPRALLILLLFVVPGTIAYATTMSNIGLIFRQRIPIVMVVSLLSAVAWGAASPDRLTRPPATRAEGPRTRWTRPRPATARGPGVTPQTSQTSQTSCRAVGQPVDGVVARTEP
ncbi:hypothetical protein [Streptosporangium sp. NPDC002524]|uniref:hypothetical protein n=1 Tax=Streptosporangium sp. NPDC002524 TaxID=3154537 RepID=UPI00332648E9